ncbi:hypothetical protein I4U23_000843 [Adineta vaga]|nr:hypothetical protein I4U23_000843 [Adineta vaga]
MYRVFLILVFLAYCSSFPFTGSNTQKTFQTVTKDDTDTVDNSGAGYSYFSKQNIALRPSMRSSFSNVNQEQDKSEYRQSSALSPQPKQNHIISTNNNQNFNKAFGQQKLIPQSNFDMQPPVSQTLQFQQPVTTQFDRSPLLKGFHGQQSNLLNQNVFSNEAQDVQPISPKQILLRPTALNIQQNTLNAKRNQQQLNTIPQQPNWNSQQTQQFNGFSSSFKTQNQRPVSFSSDDEFVQQSVIKPIVNTAFMSSATPPRRVVAQSQFAPKVSNNGW